jgi:hypothetical protein
MRKNSFTMNSGATTAAPKTAGTSLPKFIKGGAQSSTGYSNAITIRLSDKPFL